MLSDGKVAEIRSLCDRYSCREISRRTGVSRATVEKIKNGRRPEPVKRRNTNEIRGIVFASVMPYRCPECGQRVKERPCRICQVRTWNREDEAKRT